MANSPETKQLAEKIYQQNIELAAKNETLSLFKKLYQISTLTLTPEEMASQIADIIRKELTTELVGIFVFEKETDALSPLAFSKSDALIKNLNKLESIFENTKIIDISKREFFKKIVYEKEDVILNDIQELYIGLTKIEDLKEIKTKSGIKAVLVYPLIKGNDVTGILLMGLSVDYSTLSNFEKESIKNCLDVTALLLDKAYLYKNLQASYEIEKIGKEQAKRAYEVERKAKEDVQELDKNKTEFMLITQHHLRTPLSVNAGFLDLLTQGEFGKIPKKINDIILELKESTDKEIKVVNELLDVSSYQLGKELTKLIPGVDIEDLLNETLKDLKIQAEKKGIYLKFEKEGVIPKISSDRTKLKIALTNIIDNCVKYTKQGGVTIILKSDNGTVIILVKDTGMGIAKELLPNLFNHTFQRSEEAKKQFAVGKGIGLFLSGKIIEGHHGKIWAESEGEGKGSTFHIELPVV